MREVSFVVSDQAHLIACFFLVVGLAILPLLLLGVVYAAVPAPRRPYHPARVSFDVDIEARAVTSSSNGLDALPRLVRRRKTSKFSIESERE